MARNKAVEVDATQIKPNSRHAAGSRLVDEHLRSRSKAVVVEATQIKPKACTIE